MATYGLDELQSLIAAKGDFCISIFFPTYHRGADIQQNRIRFKTLIHNAKFLLVQKGWKNVRAGNFLLPLKFLLRDQTFWQHPTEGLAFFLNPDLFLYYRLRFHFQEQVMVDERFLIRPLLPLLSDNRDFFVLALSENGHRFFRGLCFGF